jgi:hypothetical protein
MNSAAPDLYDYRIDLVAIAPERNIRRRYAIVASRDLFGHVVVDLSWGRIGTDEQARRFVVRVLRRRENAKRRIGVAYRPADAIQHPASGSSEYANMF